MNEVQIDFIYIDGIIFGFLTSTYEEENYNEIILALSFFGLSIKWR